MTTVMHFKIHRVPKDYWRFTPDGIELLLNRFKILDCTLEGDMKRPKGIWVTAQKTSHLEEWGKLPPLRRVGSDDQILKKLRRRMARLKRMIGLHHRGDRALIRLISSATARTDRAVPLSRDRIRNKTTEIIEKDPWEEFSMFLEISRSIKKDGFRSMLMPHPTFLFLGL